MKLLNGKIAKAARNVLKNTNSRFQTTSMREEALAEKMSARLRGFKDTHQENILSQIEKDIADPASELSQELKNKALENMDVDSLASQLFKNVEAETPKKNWMARHKIATGLGALGAGGLAYHTFGGAGTPLPNGGVSAEEMGAQAAMQYMMMETPMPQVEAANLNYEGPMMEAQRARG